MGKHCKVFVLQYESIQGSLTPVEIPTRFGLYNSESDITAIIAGVRRQTLIAAAIFRVQLDTEHSLQVAAMTSITASQTATNNASVFVTTGNVRRDKLLLIFLSHS